MVNFWRWTRGIEEETAGDQSGGEYLTVVHLGESMGSREGIYKVKWRTKGPISNVGDKDEYL